MSYILDYQEGNNHYYHKEKQIEHIIELNFDLRHILKLKRYSFVNIYSPGEKVDIFQDISLHV